MKTDRLIAVGKALAYAIVVLGIIHDIATFTPLVQSGLSCVSPADLHAIIYMSLMCGTSLILSGIILIMILKKIEEFRFMNSIAIAIGTFLGLSGIASVVFMFDNPFAWLSLVLNLSMFGITLGLKRNFGKS